MPAPKSTYFTNKKIVVQFVLSLLVFFIHFSVFSVFGEDPQLTQLFGILRMATRWGARALLDDKIYGSLEVGKKADLIVIDPKGPSMMPVNDKIASLVTAMHSNNVQSTMCNGKWLMRDRVILTLDEEAILKEACARGAAIYDRAGIKLPDRFPVVKV
jgi:5-methylthioadenosine/S-adenosylhomocysteine deaminase